MGWGGDKRGSREKWQSRQKMAVAYITHIRVLGWSLVHSKRYIRVAIAVIV